MLTASQFRALFPHCSPATAQAQLPLLNATMAQYGITSKQRIAAFCATLAQESGEFRYRSEIASGRAYEGRRDLGNIKRGDGVAMKGHGRIQITGRTNHTAYARYIKKSGHVPYVDFSDQRLAKKICEDPYALDSAGWFWSVLKRLNQFADRGNFLRTQIKVNGRNSSTGKPNHWKQRLAYYERALLILPDYIAVEAAPPAVVIAEPAPTVIDAPEQSIEEAAAPAIDAELPSETTDKDDDASVVDGELLQKAAANESAREAGKSLLTRVGLRIGRPLAILYAALEAGNAFAWLGVIVIVVGLALVIYFERAALRRVARKVAAKVKGWL